VYSSSLLSYFYSASGEGGGDSSDCYSGGYSSSGQQTSTNYLIYHKVGDIQDHPVLSPLPPPTPPPLPKRNSLIFPSQQARHTLVYNKDSPKPLHILLQQSNTTYSNTMDSKISSSIKDLPSEDQSPLPQTVAYITHELHTQGGRDSPQSESESLVLESTAYVKAIRQRRKAAHATLLRANSSNPGARLQRMLGYRLEQRLVKVLSIHKNRGHSKSHGKKKKSKSKHNQQLTDITMDDLNRKKLPNLLRKISHRLGGKSKPLNKYVIEFNEADYHEEDVLPSEHDIVSRSPTPRFIVDRGGAFHWPPKNINLSHQVEAATGSKPEPTMAQSDESSSPDKKNFTLKSPSNAPCVLGWLQVNPDSHVFTPALADDGDEKGPFKKAPFHSNMHVLTTKI